MTTPYMPGNSGESKAVGGWTEDRIARLRSLWSKGWTCTQIAQSLGGISRNAVIGKVRRLNLAFRVTPGDSTAFRNAAFGRRDRRSDPRPRIRKARPEVKPPPRIRDMNPADPSLIRDPLLDVARVSFADLEPHHCKWPVGVPTQGFCGHTKVPGTPYCRQHVIRAYGAPAEPIAIPAGAPEMAEAVA